MVVVALGPGRFYGSSLPRPRFYGDSKLNGGDRVDPPAPVTEPLLMWAREAHWSMGGLSFQRRRLQGRIEGSIHRLRAHLEKEEEKKKKKEEEEEEEEEEASSVVMAPLRDPSEPDEEEEVVSVVSNKRKRARKLGEEFDRIASREGIATRTRSRRSAADDSEEEGAGKAAAAVRRTSPRKKNNKAVA